ncbi:MAG: hypothetical protein Q9162_007133, partial [Coniocarpon cinnabarinum]
MGAEKASHVPISNIAHRRTHPSPLVVLIATVFLFFTWPTTSTATRLTQIPQTFSNFIRQASQPLLEVFQVAPPVLTPFSNGFHSTTDPITPTTASTSEGCATQQTLMVNSFANSYGTPFVGSYSPPANCNFNRVTLNLTVTSAGRQFDRLGIVYLNSTEIWRTSTAEPTADGIIWTYVKDVSHLLALWREPQTLIFDLGNLIDDTYTAAFNATLVATFWESAHVSDAADRILSVSNATAGENNLASVFTVPPAIASNEITLPRNVRKAVVSVSATGQIDEEFWYTNTLTSLSNTFNASGVTLLPYSPFREVQLYIDSTLAGVVWPFPVIFTGGIVPGFWRPIVGIDAFDLREDEIDVTPWLGLLCDGNPHNISIAIAGIAEDGKGGGEIAVGVGSYWLVTGKVFLWLDPEGSVTTGAMPTVESPAPSVQLSSQVGKSSNGTNNTLSYSVDVSRDFSVNSTITTANGTSSPSWTQSLTYSNKNELTNTGVTQYATQDTSGTDLAPLRPYARRINYPITVNSTFTQTDTDLSITGVINRGEDIFVAGDPVFPTGLESFNVSDVDSQQFQGTQLSTSQNGSAYYLRSPALNVSSGTTSQDLTLTGVRVDGFDGFPNVQSDEELYARSVTAVNGTVTQDSETLEGQGINGFEDAPAPLAGPNVWAAPNAMKVLGRGSGDNTVGVAGPP